MKAFITAFFALIAISAFSQDQKNNPAFWVIEQNVNQKNLTTMKIYSGNQQLLKEITIEGRNINIQKRKHKRLLNRMMNNYVKTDVLAAGKNKTNAWSSN